jgi:PQQ-dependent catabolism-associated CXXCW motif protein
MIRAAALAAACLLCAAAAAEPPPAEPAGYRLDEYRAPVPATLAGARVLSTEQALALWRDKGGAFVDVLPRPPKPAGLPPDAVWRDKPRHDIPGSIWLPDTGYGAISDATRRYLESGLSRATGHDKSRLVVFYCLADCWMSWNAAKRAMTLGYSNVAWYPEGADGWAKAGYPLEPREPEPRAD